MIDQSTARRRLVGRRRMATTLLALLLSGFGVLLTGCAEPVAEAASGAEPAQMEPVTGTEFKKITLTQRAVERLGLATAQVAGSESALTVPYAAVLYDADGGTWVYTNPEPLVYLRAKITVDRIDGDTAALTEGPPAGTTVVTLGAAELFGAEFDTPH